MEDILPYSLEEPHIDLKDDDYGIWYLDIQDHPERYVDKTITFKAQAMTSMKLPRGAFIPGRNAMTCCEEDIRFFGFLCKYDRARTLKKGQWVKVHASSAGSRPTSMRGRRGPLCRPGGADRRPGGSPGVFPLSAKHG